MSLVELLLRRFRGEGLTRTEIAKLLGLHCDRVVLEAITARCAALEREGIVEARVSFRRVEWAIP